MQCVCAIVEEKHEQELWSVPCYQKRIKDYATVMEDAILSK